MPIDITRRRAERELMVRDQIERRGISRHDLLEALRKVPREAFVPPNQADAAYRDMPIFWGEGQVLTVGIAGVTCCVGCALSLQSASPASSTDRVPLIE